MTVARDPSLHHPNGAIGRQAAAGCGSQSLPMVNNLNFKFLNPIFYAAFQKVVIYLLSFLFKNIQMHTSNDVHLYALTTQAFPCVG